MEESFRVGLHHNKDREVFLFGSVLTPSLEGVGGGGGGQSGWGNWVGGRGVVALPIHAPCKTQRGRIVELTGVCE